MNLPLTEISSMKDPLEREAPDSRTGCGTKYRAILLFGAPGSGKGTQGRLLGGASGFFHCACGDVFRSLDVQSPLGQAFTEYSSRGQLVPDELTIQLWQKRLADHVEESKFLPGEQWLVLDGIPRNQVQARLMEVFIDVEQVFYLQCKDPELLEKRLGRRASESHRPDDRYPEVVRRRLALFESESVGVLDCYSDSIVKTLDAAASPQQIHAEILSQILGNLRRG